MRVLTAPRRERSSDFRRRARKIPWLTTTGAPSILPRTAGRRHAGLLYGLGIGLLLAIGDTGPAWAACSTSGNTVNCTPGTPQTTRIGNGDPSDNVTVNVQANAQVTVGNDNAISLGDNANITLGTNATVTNNATSTDGRYGAGGNTIEFGSNGNLTIGTGAVVTANGNQNSGEPINVMGSGNTITNFGTISSRSGAAIWFEDRVTGAGNTIDNYGVIETRLGANANVIGNQRTSDVTFINRTGATVRGSLSFAGGNDTLILETGSVITGSFNGGGGTNTLSLSGAGNDSLAGDIRNFQTLTKDGTGRWTLTGAIGANGGNAALQVFVNAGTLALTGNNANFNGSVTVAPAGTLEGRAQSLPPSILDNGVVRFAQDTAGTYSGVISGSGQVEKTLGGDLTLSGTNTYSGGTVISSGAVFISSDVNLGAASGGVLINGGTLGAIADVTTARTITLGPLGGGLSAAAGTTLTDNGRIIGSGGLTKTGAGTVILNTANSYIGGTTITDGVLQISSNANLGAAPSTLTLNGGTLRTAASMTIARPTTVTAAGGTIETVAGTTLTDNSTISGPGTLTKTGAGTLDLTGTNTHGGTAINGGVVHITQDANLGAAGATLSFDGGTLLTDNDLTIARAGFLGPGGGTLDTAAGTLTYTGVISGSGGLTATGAGGNAILTGNNTYTGETTVAAGYLVINGDQSAATGLTTVQSGGRLSGSGIIGGDVVVEDGGILAPGSAPFTPATLTINGDLQLSGTSNIFYNVRNTTVGDALNDLTIVHGDLTLDGVINVLDEGQDLGAGVYRIFNYDGTLTDNGLDIGGYQTEPGGATRPLDGFSVQTVVPGQINLINTTGLNLNYWDGSAAANKNNNLIEGGDGTWFHAGPDALGSWTDPAGAVNAPWADDQFAIFIGAPGTVTASNADGQITTSGMQFGVSGYLLQGDPLLLVGSSDTPGESTIRVGDGTSAGTGMTATISAALTGSTLLRKTDSGTLILSGANSYAGGTRIEGGAIQVAADASLGAAGTTLTLQGGTLRTTASFTSGRSTVLATGGGTFETAAATTLSLTGAMSGAGLLRHAGPGTLTLLSDSSHSGGTLNLAGTLQLGNGGTTGGITGAVINLGTLLINRSNQLVLDGAIAGGGSLVQAGTGTTVLAANNLYTGLTTISAGTLQLGNGGTTGSVVGNILDNAALVIDRSNELTFAGVISGTGTFEQAGTGTTILTGSNTYTGATTVSSGFLLVNGDQSAATGLTTVASGARLSGGGVIGGDVTIAGGGALSAGSLAGLPGILTINGDLTLSPDAITFFNVANTDVGGALNDLVNVGGDLTLDGVINILDTGQNLGPGVYRIYNYAGTLIDNGLAIGSFTSDPTTPTRPLDGFSVQTVIPGQVNLVNTAGLALNYWDGSAGPKNDGVIQGGDGTWFNAGPDATSAWTDPGGTTNAPWADDQFAIFIGAPGTVTASNADGQIRVSGMQFGVDGYVLQGDAIELLDPVTANVTFIRVGDGTAAGAAMTATITAPLTGTALLIKDDLGTLILTAANTHTSGTGVYGGTLQISADNNLGAAGSAMALVDGGTLRTTESFSIGRTVLLGSDDPQAFGGGVIETLAGTTLTLTGATIEDPSAPGAQLEKAGDGTLVLTAANGHTGATTISAGTLQLGNGGTSGSLIGPIIDNAALVVDRSNELTLAGVISGTGTFEQAGTGTTILTAENSYTGGTTISAGTLQIGNGGTSGHVVGDILNNSILVINRSDTKLTPGVISGSGQLIQAGAGTTVLQADNTYTGGTTINAGTLQIGDGGITGSIVGNVANESVIAFNRSDVVTFAGVISGSGSLEQLGTGTTILTGANTMTGGATVSAGTLQIGDGGTSGQLFGDILNNGTVILDRADNILYSGDISGTGNTIKNGAGILVVTGSGTYTGGTTINEGVLQLGDGGTSGSLLGDVVNNAALVVDRSDSLLLNGVISGTGRFEQAGTGTTIFEANNSYTGGTLISGGTLQIGNGGETGLVPGDVVNNGKLVINRSNTKLLEGVVSGTGELVQAGLGTLIIENTNSYSGGTAVEAGVLQISRDDNLGDASGGLRLSSGTLRTTADMTTARATVLAQGGGTIETLGGTTLTHDGLIEGAGSLTKTGAGLLILSGANTYDGPTDIVAGTLWVYGDQTAAMGPTTVFDTATLGGIGTIGGDVAVLDGGTLAPGDTPGTLTVAGGLSLSEGAILDYEFGQANVPGGALNDLTVIAGDLVLDGTIDVTVSAGGTFDPGVYRVFDYGGTLTNNGLALGVIPSGTYYVQTSIAGQVNLVNTTGLTLNYWDGAAGTKNDGVVSGGDGVWQNFSGNDNWTTDTGALNAPFTDAAVAYFGGAAGNVTVDASLGSITVSGMQFTTGGYVISGDQIILAGPEAEIGVGDGSAAGAGMTATVASVLAGASSLSKTDLGTLVLSGANTYTGGTAINGGVLEISADANLGAAAGALSFDGGTLRVTAPASSARAVTLGAGGGTIETDGIYTLSSAATGAGALTKAGTGTLILTGDSSYTGGTTIAAGTLQLGNGGTSGSIAGDVLNNGTLAFNRSNESSFGGTITGAGNLVKTGTGNTILTANNAYTGTTEILAGYLYVDGDQSAATGLTSVASGARLGGNGIVGGAVTVADGGTIAPGVVPLTPATLTINGPLTLSEESILFYNLLDTNPGGPLNDLLVVDDDLTLDGVIHILDQGQDLGPGVYRIINYTGTLTNNDLRIGDYLSDPDTSTGPITGFSVQTAIAGQVNLINTAGLTLTFWDGDAGTPNDGTISGGDGVWRNAGPTIDWTDSAGAINAGWTDSGFAVFTAAPGTVTVSNENGQVRASGMQFQTDGYAIDGGPLELVGGQSIIRVGDGTSASAGITATIAAALTGASTLVKTDLGTLVLTGANTYTGGTAIDGGVLQIASDANLGDAAGALSLDTGTLRTTADLATARTVTLEDGGGTFETVAATTLTLNGTVGGTGSLTKAGDGTLILSGTNTYAGGTAIDGGVLQVASDANLGAASGGLSFDGGTLRTTADFTAARATVLEAGGGTIDTAAALTLAGPVSGEGALTKIGSGTLTLAGEGTYTGLTTIAGGTLRIGAGGTAGSVVGDVLNNATLAFDRSDSLTHGGVISGSGTVIQAGAGTTTLTGANSYAGPTQVNAGTLLVNGDQSAATGLTSVASGGTLGGTGTIGGSVTVADGGTFAPGQGVGTLTIAGDLSLAGGSRLAYDFGQAGVVGGPLNDLAVVQGDLVLDGTIDVALASGGSIDPGIYRVISYAGTLTNNTLEIGTMPSPGFSVQTSVANQVNLVNTAGLTLNYWDGAAGPKNDGVANGGDGLWQAAAGNDNWTTATGTPNAPFADASFAVFAGAPGTVTVDASLGAINVAGMQFATDGYLVQGDTIGLAGTTAVIRVGDGTSAGTAMTATVGSVLAGAAGLTKSDLGTLILSGANTYAGGTAVNGGVLQVTSDANLGAAAGNLALDGGTLRNTGAISMSRAVTLGTLGGTFDTQAALTLDGVVSGSGSLAKTGAGTLTLTGANSYAGATTVAAGALYVEGDQSAATGATSLASGTLLGGSGTIGGDVTLANGATLSPGSEGAAPGTLTIAGDLSLAPGATLAYSFGQADVVGGPLNDHTVVGGDLVLDGTIDVTLAPGGSLGPGIYRVISYAGALTDNGLAIGTMPSPGFSVQTSIANQVNLVNGAGLTLNYWDGAAGPKNDGAIQGGDGLWQASTGNDNWTTAGGTPNAPFTNGAFAVFAGAPGTVTADQSLGAITVAGMQFAADGYLVQGAPINLTGSSATVRVGDGTAAGADMTATITSALAGSSRLTKTDLGTLVLTGTNTYSGGTAIDGGVLEVAADTNLGAASGTLGLDGGTLRTVADMASARATTLGALGGTFETATGTTLTLTGAFAGAGSLTKAGEGTLLLTADAGYTGGTTIAAGTLQLGNGGTSGGILGDVANNGTLVFNRSNIVSFDGTVSGTGSLVQAGTGITVLTGDNSYTGATEVRSGQLWVNGDQSAATGPTSVLGGATLGGAGTIGGDVAVLDGGTLAPGGGTPGTLTIAGDLSLSGGSLLAYEFGQANVAGGAFNDLTVVGGDLVLDGTINVTVPAGGVFSAGIYRVFDYGGTLIDNGLDLGTVPDGDYYVQTSVLGQVNLINTTGLTLNWWDGAAGPKNDGVIQGGDGVWLAAPGNDNWTIEAGSPNAPFTDASFAIFSGAAGTVTVDTSLGAINVAGMQFATDGYVVQGDAINLAGSTVRVGDGTAAGAGMTATIGSVLTGSSGLAKFDLGTLILTGANTYTGGTAIDGGVLQVASDGNLGAAPGGLSFNGGTLRTSASFTSDRAATLNAAGGTIETAPSTSFTLNGAIDGAGALTKAGAGTLVLGGASSYTGGTTIAAGVLQIAADANLGAATGPLTLDSGTLRTTADISTARPVTLAAGGGTIETAANTAFTVQSAVQGPGGLAKTGDGALILLANNAYTGASSVLGGALILGDVPGSVAAIGGPVSVAAGATLGGYGTVRGDVTNDGTLAVADALDRLSGAGTGQFAIQGTLLNRGTVDLAGAMAGNRVIVGSYTGVNGTININAVLAGDDSPADRLVIDGGGASGSSVLVVNNLGGGGAATPGNGIQVVEALNGATTAPGAFALSGRAVAGPYQYNLFRGGRDGAEAESWFLRSQSLVPIDPPVEPPYVPPPEEPLYRDEVPVYTALPSMALMFGRSLVGTLHERVGDRERQIGRTGESGTPAGAWGRVIGEDGEWDAEPGGVYNEGPAFEHRYYALQAGLDLVRDTSAGGLTVAGLYVAAGQDEGTVEDFDGTRAGHVKFDAYTIGAYATHYGAGGWYVDGVLQATRYDAHAGSYHFADLETKGTGISASIEGGIPFAIGGGFKIEPQAQLIYQTIDFDDASDEAAEVRFDDVDSLTGRLGVRLSHDGSWPGPNGPRPLTTWLRANVWREFTAQPVTSFSSEDGPVPFRSDIRATWAEFGAGVSAEVRPGSEAYVSASYQTSFGQEASGVNLRAGLRFDW